MLCGPKQVPVSLALLCGFLLLATAASKITDETSERLTDGPFKANETSKRQPKILEERVELANEMNDAPGSVILEDLVNQFLEKQKYRELVQQDTEVDNEAVASGSLVDGPQNGKLEQQNENFVSEYHDGLVGQELDDRHIHYDEQPRNQQRLSNYKLLQPEQADAAAATNNTVQNFTLALIRTPELAAINRSTETARSSPIQARSMGAGSGQSVSKVTQFSRPPYDFNQLTANYEVLEPTRASSPSKNSFVVVAGNETSQQQNLLNSISKISSHLATEQQQISRSDQPEVETKPQEMDEKQLLKFAPANKPVDLNPIDASALNRPNDNSNSNSSNNTNTNNNNSNQHQNHNNSPEYFPQHRTQPSRGGHNDRYESDAETNHARRRTSSSQAPKPETTFYVDVPTIKQLDNSLTDEPIGEPLRNRDATSGGLHLKTLEDLGQVQLQLADKSHHIAASLTNVTAPMNPPIFPSEAMDSQAYSTYKHLASGFLRPSSVNKAQPEGALSAPPKRTNYSTSALSGPQRVSPMNGVESRIQSIYSQPANQFFSKQTPLLASDMEKERTRQDGYFAASHQSGSNPRRPAFGMPAISDRTQAPPGGSWPILSAHSLASSSPPSPASSPRPPGAASGGQAHSTRPPISIDSDLATSTIGPILSEFMTGSGHSNSSSSATPTTATVTTTTTATAGTSLSLDTNISTGTAIGGAGDGNGLSRRVYNLTRVEHISAECSNDLIRTIIVFNGTFKGIIYSSGYVRDPTCIYINGTGKTKYEFSIRLNQCGTLAHQEVRQASGDGRNSNEVHRRDQVMWNTLSIQYNPIIEQEWDEHFRVSCEYGSDFWKTVSFSPFNVETNTGSPVTFTVEPPQCQMEILRGHGMVGPRQEAISGPVTVGDPLTLLIHMKSEKAGYDILVRNCVAHNGGHQKMQLIDANGCVVNERFISPFRGTYNDNDLKHVTLYSYLKAFRFTGSPVLYLECEIHMCQSACPPQMCYWRRLSKRDLEEERAGNGTDLLLPADEFQNYQDRREMAPQEVGARRKARKLGHPTTEPNTTKAGQISDKLSLFQALEVRQEREPDGASPYSLAAQLEYNASPSRLPAEERNLLLCYRKAEVLGFLFTAGSLLAVALSVAVGCCWRVCKLRRRERRRLTAASAIAAVSAATTIQSANDNRRSSGKVYGLDYNHHYEFKAHNCQPSKDDLLFSSY